MKIIHLSGFYPEIGGPYITIQNLTEALYQKGIKSGICSVLPTHYDKSKLENSDYLEDLIYLESKGEFFTQLWPSFSKQWKRVVKKIEEYDLIHIHGIFDYYAFFVYKCIKKPYIISPHGSLLPFLLTRRSAILKKLYLFFIGKKILRKAKAIIVNTLQEKACVIKFGVDKDKVFNLLKILSFSDLSEAMPEGALREKFPYLKDKKIILFLGRISWEKGLDDLIPAFAELVKIRKDVHLLIAGPDSKGYMSKVNKWVKKIGISDFVSFAGAIYGRDKIMFLQGADIFIAPSYSESFGISVLEAMYMGLPVIITENIGAKEYVEKAMAGFVVKKDMSMITSAMLELISNETMRKKMGNNGRLYIEKGFTANNPVNNFIKIYEKVLNNGDK